MNLIRTMLPYFGKRKQVTYHLNLSYWCSQVWSIVPFSQAKSYAETLILLRDMLGKTSWNSIDVSGNDRHILLFYKKCHFCHLLPFAKVGQNGSAIVLTYNSCKYKRQCFPKYTPFPSQFSSVAIAIAIAIAIGNIILYNNVNVLYAYCPWRVQSRPYWLLKLIQALGNITIQCMCCILSALPIQG